MRDPKQPQRPFPADIQKPANKFPSASFISRAECEQSAIVSLVLVRERCEMLGARIPKSTDKKLDKVLTEVQQLIEVPVAGRK